MSDISVILRTSTFRGDHSADVIEPCELLPGESVEDLVSRLLVPGGYDWVEIRLVRLAPKKEASRG